MSTKKQFTDEQLKSMRTAFLTAYPKIFTNIKYSTEIFSYTKELALKHNFSFLPNMFNNEMSIEIEARHKATSKVLAKHITSDTLIIEIASGMSPRNLEFENENYLEIDFEPIISIKKAIYKAFGKEKLTNNLYGIDLTNINELKKFLSNIIKQRHFKQIIIVSEGLFWYLTKEQISNLTQTFIDSFTDIDWIWITADCPTEELSEESYRKVISNSANVKRGTFENYEDFSNFFKNLGLNNTKFYMSKLLKYNDLSSAKLFSVDRINTMKRIDNYTKIAKLEKIF